MLYIVGTPIGNLGDITQRALEILRATPTIVMESPQDSMKLLRAFKLPQKNIIKFNERNKKAARGVVEHALLSGDVVYITSAGMPGISDPGADIVCLARACETPVTIIPGVSALTSAIALSGMTFHEFTFVGFLPKKAGQIKKIFSDYVEKNATLIFFESPFRIVKTMTTLQEIIPTAHVFIAKELTKVFEKTFKGAPSDIIAILKENPKNTKGEFVAIVQFKEK